MTVSCGPPLPVEAVTVTVEFPAGVTGPVGGDEVFVVLPPPQPEMNPAQPTINPARRSTVSENRVAAKIRLRRLKHRMKLASPLAAYAMVKLAEGTPRKSLFSDDVVDTFVAIVSVVVRAALDPVGDSIAGLKVQVEYSGRPEQLRLTVPLNPPFGVSVIVEVPDCPAAMVREVGLAARENAGVTEVLTVMLRLAVAISGVLSESFTSTVKLEVAAVVGVPEISPVLVASDSPAGSIPELTTHV